MVPCKLIPPVQGNPPVCKDIIGRLFSGRFVGEDEFHFNGIARGHLHDRGAQPFQRFRLAPGEKESPAHGAANIGGLLVRQSRYRHFHDPGARVIFAAYPDRAQFG